MGLFQPITASSQLPQAGTNAETLALDIKREVDTKEHLELAKDVTAFANATGGVILVGAIEDRKHGSVGRYLPVERSKAKEIRDSYNLATRDRCSPKPLIDPAIIECQAGFVVAVNVWPFPGQAVGVRISKEPLAFAFPFRTGVETIWLTAEQLPMLMVPELRRISILLDAIPKGAEVGILRSDGKISAKCSHVELRALENVVVLEVHRQIQRDVPARESPIVHLPIDVIRSVWKAHSGQWQFILAGELTETGWGGAIYFPVERKL